MIGHEENGRLDGSVTLAPVDTTSPAFMYSVHTSPPDSTIDRRLSVAPMMDWTDRHCRFFHRVLTQRTLLYTEMVTTGALLHGNQPRHLDFHPAEHPLALQLGGSEPAALSVCAALAQAWGYDEVNLNVGCPSDRVQNGRFGACLMAEPALVGDCLAAMAEAVDIPVTVKHRIGVDELDSYDHLAHFVDTVAAAGCRTFIVHARKAWLTGLSPKENRDIPPLQYPLVYRLKLDFPHLEIIINGGIQHLDEARVHLAHVDGVMLGRAAYQHPARLRAADRVVFGDTVEAIEPAAAVEAMLPYIDAHLAAGGRLADVTRHMLGLFQGVPGARGWRRYLSENAHRPGAGIEVVRTALSRVHGEPATA